MRLTDKAVADLALAVGETDRIYFDDALTGFGYRLRAGAGGRLLRSWIVQYKRAGRSCRVLIGAGVLVGAEPARAAAKKLLAQVALGQDPGGDRRDRRGRDAVTLRSTVPDYLASAAKRVRPRSLYETRRYLVGPHFKPLQGLAIDRIDRRAVAARLVQIERENGAQTAMKARAALSGFYTWAMRSGLTDSNPADQAPKPAVGAARERVLSDDEFVAIWRATDDSADYSKIVRLLALCGARRSEIGGMTWSELDFDAGIWTLPADRSKNHRPHILPIMPMMIEIIAGTPRRATRPHLFGAHSAVGFNGWDSGKRALDARSGVKDWTVHDIRRTAATRMADLGIAPHIIETILNHQSGHKRGPAGTYNRSVYAREVKTALALWHDHVRRLVAGGERKVLPWPKPPLDGLK